MNVGLVCDQCDFFNEMGTADCTSCGAGLGPAAAGAADATPEPEAETKTPAPAQDGCPQCGAEVMPNFRFCGSCGYNLAEAPAEPAADAAPASKTMFFGAMQTPDRAKLVLIRGEGMDGVTYHLNGTEHFAGRENCDILFPEDPLLSGKHACFYYEGQDLYVRNESTVNGVYVRITGEVPIQPSSAFLVGEQLLQFELINEGNPEEPQADEQGTYFYGSPRRPGFFKLVQHLRGAGDLGMIFRAPSEEVSLGREGNDINFPDDPFISGQHALVRVRGESYSLIDLNSKNGTFFRIEQPTHVRHGDYVFLGQQLMRVEVS